MGVPRTPTARDLAAAILLEEERKRTRIRDLLASRRAGLPDSRDRGLLTEVAYGVVRRKGTLDAVLAPRSRRPIARLSGPVRTALRLALYQVLFLDRVPAHAAVDHAVSWVRRGGGAKAAGYVNAVLRASVAQVQGPALGKEDPRRDVPREDGSAIRLRDVTFADPASDLTKNLAARYSCPRWLVARWLELFGEERTRAALRVGIMRPPLSLRARGSRDDLYHALKEAGASVRAGHVDTALLVEGTGESAALAAVQRGEAWVQDGTAQRVAPLLRPERGQRVLDLCAAPGGKTLHLADLLEGQGEVVACDVESEKVEGLRELAAHVRGDVRFEVRQIEREGELPFEPASFDAVLVDAPCTNTGVLRRRVEVRWRLKPEDIGALAEIQRDLLERALPLVKPGGRLVYTTCSLEPDENEAVAAAFFAAHEDALEREHTLEAPAGRDADGGFAAVFLRT